MGFIVEAQDGTASCIDHRICDALPFQLLGKTVHSKGFDKGPGYDLLSPCNAHPVSLNFNVSVIHQLQGTAYFFFRRYTNYLLFVESPQPDQRHKGDIEGAVSKFRHTLGGFKQPHRLIINVYKRSGIFIDAVEVRTFAVRIIGAVCFSKQVIEVGKQMCTACEGDLYPDPCMEHLPFLYLIQLGVIEWLLQFRHHRVPGL